MKRFVFLGAALALLVFVGGCQSIPSSVTAAQLSTNISNSSVQIQAETGVVTSLALLTVPAKDRPAATTEVHNVALAVQQALNQTNPTLDEAKTLVLAAIQKNGGPYTDIISVAFDSLAGLVDAELQRVYSNVSTDQKAAAGLSLIRAVAAGVVSATSSTPAAAASQPTSSAWIPRHDPELPSPYDILRRF